MRPTVVRGDVPPSLGPLPSSSTISQSRNGRPYSHAAPCRHSRRLPVKAATRDAAPPPVAAAEQQSAAPPPYSQLSTPVYSLATVGPDGSSPTMNLVTYAAPVSLQPRTYALGLYQGTLSRQNMLATRVGVLQVLGEQHAPLFELLGRTSGRDVDKLAQLAAGGAGVSRRPADGIPLLDDSLGWIELRLASEPVNYGDHDVVICEVACWHTPSATADGGPARPLYTGRLRELGLM